MINRTAWPNASTQRRHRIGAPLPSRRRDTGSSYIESPLSSSDASVAGIAEVEVETAALRSARVRSARRFLKGPIPLDDIAIASRLPGRALAVFLAVHHRQALTKNPVVTLPKGLMAELGVTKDAKARALHLLEAAALVRIDRQVGRSPTITLTATHEEIQNEAFD
jgi:hypothetical protein